jgi:hypothetical protein
MKYQVGTFRDAGLQAKWRRTRNGAPIIIVRQEDEKTWMAVTDRTWKDMKERGIMEGFHMHYTFIDYFSVPV